MIEELNKEYRVVVQPDSHTRIHQACDSLWYARQYASGDHIDHPPGTTYTIEERVVTNWEATGANVPDEGPHPNDLSSAARAVRG